MRRKVIAAIIFCLLVLIGAAAFIVIRNSVHRNDPPDPGTPVPDPHDGVFECVHGTMTFNGDGKSIELSLSADLAEVTGLPEGVSSGTYRFLSGDLPPHGSVETRYDVAHELEITAGGKTVVLQIGVASADGKTYTVGWNTVTEKSIPIVVEVDGKHVTEDFIKQ
jgi:hypothetical protein